MNRVGVLAVAAVASSLAASGGFADVIAGWTINTALPTGTDVPMQPSYVYGAAEEGVLAGSASTSLFGVHANEITTWTSPAGNGSPRSFSSNRWAIGDYYQVDLSTSGFTAISLSWDQARSSTGPQFFDLLYSLDGGGSWTTALVGYEVLQSGGGSAPGTWNSTTYNPIYTSSFSFGAELDDQATVSIRFQAAVAPGGESGSNRLDNIFIEGVPSPGAVALLAMAGLAGRRRRR